MPRSIAPFTREAQLAVPVSGVPAGGDADADGVSDDRDQCLGSDLQANVVIGGNDSNVANQLLANTEGCTMMDLIRQASQSGDRSEFLRGVALLTRTWLNDGLISNADVGAIRTAAARADSLPLP